MAERARRIRSACTSLKPAPGSRRPRKRLGRGPGTGHGKTSGRGHKGAGARSGNKRKPAYEGGQNPIHMRMRKLRGPNKKMSMPFEKFRTRTQPVNLSDLEARFKADDEVTPESLREAGLAKRRHPVKILARGEISKKLTVKAHAFSARPRRRSRRPAGIADERSSDASDDPQRLHRPGDPQEAPLHGGDPRPLPAGRLHPVARRRRPGDQGRRQQRRRLEHPRLPQPLLGRKPLAALPVRAGDHALHHGLDHPAAPDRGRALAGAAPEGGRGRPAEDHAVHALPDGRPRLRPVARLRLPVQLPEPADERDRRADLPEGVPDRRSR